MEILNIGIPEILLILVLTLILLGPEGMVSTARNLARTWRKFVHSPLWKDIVSTQREIKDIPTRLVREAGYEEIKATVQQVQHDAKETVKGLPVSISENDFNILPPRSESSKPTESGEPAPPDTDPEPEHKPEQSSKWSNLTRDHTH